MTSFIIIITIMIIKDAWLLAPPNCSSLLLQPRPGRELLLAHEGDRMNINKKQAQKLSEILCNTL